MINKLKKIYWKSISDRSEQNTIVRFLQHAGATSDWRILDVGCGYGRNLRALREAGLSASGVEINSETADSIRAEGFVCFHPDDPGINAQPWDAVVMSHIIEHFDYQSLSIMMNHYLDNLKPGGFLIIATPLLCRRFYDDFDHVKPYNPQAIEGSFGMRGRQVQLQSSNELELVDLWIRRRPFYLQLFPSFLRRRMSIGKIFIGFLNILLHLIHLASFRVIGESAAWVGLYRKS
jgi:SAM-dependent methyltransferase